jgi:mono/diheme cytochrome c family protein
MKFCNTAILSLTLVLLTAQSSAFLFYGARLAPGERSQTLSDEQLTRARALFKERCVRCHGVNGDGATVLGDMLGTPDFTDPKWWTKVITNARLTRSITSGKKEMPAFGKKLASKEILSLVMYLRLFNKSADPDKPAEATSSP